eukprot:GHVL01027137.1.p2 GENE.GHVL01027137.1~~GHVL01027137.1.p2  ORF type:complete len:390 (+),score=79.19 GHVL01027137.1:91-1260(+)
MGIEDDQAFDSFDAILQDVGSGLGYTAVSLNFSVNAKEAKNLLYNYTVSRKDKVNAEYQICGETADGNRIIVRVWSPLLEETKAKCSKVTSVDVVTVKTTSTNLSNETIWQKDWQELHSNLAKCSFETSLFVPNFCVVKDNEFADSSIRKAIKGRTCAPAPRRNNSDTTSTAPPSEPASEKSIKQSNLLSAPTATSKDAKNTKPTAKAKLFRQDAFNTQDVCEKPKLFRADAGIFDAKSDRTEVTKLVRKNARDFENNNDEGDEWGPANPPPKSLKPNKKKRAREVKELDFQGDDEDDFEPIETKAVVDKEELKQDVKRSKTEKIQQEDKEIDVEVEEVEETFEEGTEIVTVRKKTTETKYFRCQGGYIGILQATYWVKLNRSIVNILD